jgi:hypothetical protein
MFNPSDLEELRSRGITESEALRQLALFKNPPPARVLVRACSLGDGIMHLSDAQEAKYEAMGEAALRWGRVTKFTPASGAATRMFQALQGDPFGSEAQQCLNQIERFAFASELSSATDKFSAILKRYAVLPKALIPFHAYPERSRTAFEEHLREATALGIKSVHFSISPNHRGSFLRTLKAIAPALDVSFSEQKASTDTLAADEKGDPFRDETGNLVFRPGGHGALLENLNDLNADLVLIKNIDNISHSRLWPEQLRWKKIILGILAAHGGQDRPARVAGVVKNTGEPGGGPFWVARPNGEVAVQIVESAEMNLLDPQQQTIFASATHFNPVDLACSVKGFNLLQYRDNSAVFLSKKSKDGKALQALELPGLWNGAMADWNTIFVEVPAETFNPVKSINDLLRRAHQPK